MTLAGSWYPRTAKEVSKTLSDWRMTEDEGGRYSSAVVPHAGWYYSGKTASEALSGACIGKDMIFIVGGHLPSGHPVLAAQEDELEVPGGAAVNRLDILERLRKAIVIEEDVYRDNTVEVVLPMAQYYAPEADFLWLRAPADISSIKLAGEIFRITAELNINAAVIGSTDLTHYGSSYYFQPAGSGDAALKWVKEKNDAGIIRDIVKMDPSAVIDNAKKNKAACSAGAAAAAVEFGRLKGVPKGRLVNYTTSYDIRPAESFVGYAGIVF